LASSPAGSRLSCPDPQQRTIPHDPQQQDNQAKS
jgi:hypothetical protein